MNYIKRLLLHSCGYTVLTCIIFYLFAIALQYSTATMSIGRFFTILLFGLIIACAELIFLPKSLHVVIKYALHYAVIFAAFFIIFLTIKTEDGTPFSPSFIFAALTIFTFGYILIVGGVRLTQHLVSKNKKVAPQTSKSNISSSKKRRK